MVSFCPPTYELLDWLFYSRDGEWEMDNDDRKAFWAWLLTPDEDAGFKREQDGSTQIEMYRDREITPETAAFRLGFAFHNKIGPSEHLRYVPKFHLLNEELNRRGVSLPPIIQGDQAPPLYLDREIQNGFHPCWPFLLTWGDGYAAPAAGVEVEMVVTKNRFTSRYRCSHCYTYSENKLKVCARCRGVWYCHVSCQKTDWAAHKGRCVPAQLPDSDL